MKSYRADWDRASRIRRKIHEKRATREERAWLEAYQARPRAPRGPRAHAPAGDAQAPVAANGVPVIERIVGPTFTPSDAPAPSVTEVAAEPIPEAPAPPPPAAPPAPPEASIAPAHAAALEESGGMVSAAAAEAYGGLCDALTAHAIQLGGPLRIEGKLREALVEMVRRELAHLDGRISPRKAIIFTPVAIGAQNFLLSWMQKRAAKQESVTAPAAAPAPEQAQPQPAPGPQPLQPGGRWSVEELLRANVATR